MLGEMHFKLSIFVSVRLPNGYTCGKNAQIQGESVMQSNYRRWLKLEHQDYPRNRRFTNSSCAGLRLSKYRTVRFQLYALPRYLKVGFSTNLSRKLYNNRISYLRRLQNDLQVRSTFHDFSLFLFLVPIVYISHGLQSAEFTKNCSKHLLNEIFDKNKARCLLCII